MKIFYFLIMTLCLLLLPSQASALTFSDVPATHWAQEPVRFAIDHELVSGYPDGTFRPNATLREGHFVKMLTNLLYPEEISAALQTLQQSTNEYVPYYAVLEAKGYLTIDIQDAYSSIPRWQVATMLAYAINETRPNSENAYKLLKALQMTTAESYDAFNEYGSLTRAQGAAFLQRLWANFVHAPSPLAQQTKPAIETIQLTADIRIAYTEDAQFFVYENEVLQAIVHAGTQTNGGATVGKPLNEDALSCPYGMQKNGYAENNLTCHASPFVSYTYFIDHANRGTVLYTVERAKNNAKPLLAFGKYAADLNVEAIRQLNTLLVNITRGKHGLAPFAAHPLLAEVAQLHAEDMAANDFYSHANLQGQSPSDRAEQLGYHYPYIAENIFKGPKNIFEAHAGWLNSPGHRSAILSDRYTLIGSGIAAQYDENGRVTNFYYVDNFSVK